MAEAQNGGGERVAVIGNSDLCKESFELCSQLYKPFRIPVFDRLGVNDRAQAVSEAMKRKLI